MMKKRQNCQFFGVKSFSMKNAIERIHFCTFYRVEVLTHTHIDTKFTGKCALLHFAVQIIFSRSDTIPNRRWNYLETCHYFKLYFYSQFCRASLLYAVVVVFLGILKASGIFMWHFYPSKKQRYAFENEQQTDTTRTNKHLVHFGGSIFARFLDAFPYYIAI